MKRLAAFLLIMLTVAVFAASCVGSKKDPPQPITYTSSNADNPTISTSPSVTTSTSGNIITPVIGGFSDKTEGYTLTVGGKKLLGVSIVLPVSEIEASEDVKKNVSSRLNAIHDYTDEYVKNLGERYKSDNAAGISYICMPRISVSYRLNYFTTKAISLTVTYDETNGYGNSSRRSVYYNYELGTGSVISFKAIFKDDSAVISQLQSRASEAAGLYPGYASLLSLYAPSSWYVMPTHIVFSFNPYDIAPASSGFITFEIELSSLFPYMNDYGKELFGLL